MKMNKKGGFNFMSFITKGLIFAVIAFILFAIFGVGGGFKATFELGKLFAKVPAMVWLGLGVIWLISQIRN